MTGITWPSQGSKKILSGMVATHSIRIAGLCARLPLSGATQCSLAFSIVGNIHFSVSVLLLLLLSAILAKAQVSDAGSTVSSDDSPTRNREGPIAMFISRIARGLGGLLNALRDALNGLLIARR